MKKLLIIVLLITVAAAAVWGIVQLAAPPLSPTEQRIQDYANAHGLSLKDWPESLVALLERNPETEQFVLNYPTAHKQTVAVDLSEYENSVSVPLFIQWDPRWGYQLYGSDVAGITGCGPVCLSMAAWHLTRDPAYSPDRMLRFAQENGYYVKGSGSSWTLISEGGSKLGFDVKELPLDEGRMKAALAEGTPIICAMGPGAFTTAGHFIVLTGVQDGKFSVNDPNSRENSQKLWAYDEIQDQIRNLWSIGVK